MGAGGSWRSTDFELASAPTRLPTLPVLPTLPPPGRPCRGRGDLADVRSTAADGRPSPRSGTAKTQRTQRAPRRWMRDGVMRVARIGTTEDTERDDAGARASPWVRRSHWNHRNTEATEPDNHRGTEGARGARTLRRVTSGVRGMPQTAAPRGSRAAPKAKAVFTTPRPNPPSPASAPTHVPRPTGAAPPPVRILTSGPGDHLASGVGGGGPSGSRSGRVRRRSAFFSRIVS